MVDTAIDSVAVDATADPVTEQDSQKALLEALRATATLVTLRLTAWRAAKVDRAAGDDVAANNNAVAGSAKVTKNRMAGADARLSAVDSLDQQIRMTHRLLTRPWMREGQEDLGGARLLPNAAFFDYMKRMTGLKSQRDALVQDVVTNWSADVAMAIQNLGGLADTSDYPSADEIPSRFSMKLDYAPLPDSGGYGGLPPDAARILGGALHRRAEEQLRNAVRTTFGDVRAQAERIAKILGSERPRIFDSLLEDAREVLPVVRGFIPVARACGMDGDADRLDELHMTLHGAVHGLETKALKKSETLKADLLGAARGITDKLAAWGL